MARIDPDILESAMKAAGAYQVNRAGGGVVAYFNNASAYWNAGRLTIQGDITGLSDAIQRAYTGEAFKVAARRSGFQVTQDARGRLVAERRRF